MKTKETAQLAFVLGPEDQWQAPPPNGQPQVAEKELGEYRVGNIITFSGIEKIIYQDIEKVPPRNIFNASLAIGTAVDWFLVPANFIYRFRDDYCFEPELYPEWDLKEVFSSFYPTGWNFGKILALLEKHRPNFSKALAPESSALERRNIKRALIPLWIEVAKEFKLDALQFQGVVTQEDGFILPSQKTASPQTIAQIGQRIVAERFDTLVDDDKDYTYFAEPDCLLLYQLDGEIFHIQIAPDYIKRLREKRKTTKARNIVTKRIVGDFKDSEKRDLSDFETPFGKTMLVYNWLLLQIGQRLRLNQLCQVRLSNRQVRRVFLIPQEVAKPIPAESVQTALEFLQEEGEQIFAPMPKLTPDLQEKARVIFEQALRISRQVKFS